LSGQVKNLGVVDVNIVGSDDYVGGLVGYNSSDGTVTDCYSTATISGASTVGGLVYINTSSIATKDDFRQTTLAELRSLPIPSISLQSREQKDQHSKMVKLVERMLDLHKKLAASKIPDDKTRIQRPIQTVGLVEPLCVYPENGRYIILDGYLRYKAFQQLEVEMVPCQIQQSKEAYTYNRMVNNLSAVQQSRMLRQSLETINRKTIEEAFGIQSIEYRQTVHQNR